MSLPTKARREIRIADAFINNREMWNRSHDAHHDHVEYDDDAEDFPPDLSHFESFNFLK
jgi:hypothetical protein